jgi:hypothetical protein
MTQDERVTGNFGVQPWVRAASANGSSISVATDPPLFHCVAALRSGVTLPRAGRPAIGAWAPALLDMQ